MEYLSTDYVNLPKRPDYVWTMQERGARVLISLYKKTQPDEFIFTLKLVGMAFSERKVSKVQRAAQKLLDNALAVC